MLILGVALAVTGGGDPGGYCKPTQPAQSHPLMYLGRNHHNYKSS